jgi:hypothetical protein
MSDRIYTLYQKTTSRAAGDTRVDDIFTSDDIMEVLNELMNNLNIHISWGESVEMTGFGSFRSETLGSIYIYYIGLKFKEGKGPSEPAGYDHDPEHKVPEYCKECCYNPHHPCRRKIVKLNVNDGAWEGDAE